MTEKNKSKKEKRVISVGFIEPKELEGDTIYVQLTQREKGYISAQAVSEEFFKYMDYFKNFVTEGKRTTNENPHREVKNFLKMLEKQNTAVISKERFEEDGLELTKRLSHILDKGLLNLKINLTDRLYYLK